MPYTYLEAMENFLFILVVLAAFIFALFVLPRWRMRRAIEQVIETFRQYNATHPSDAKTPEELGFGQQRGGLPSLLRGRNYKDYALDMLIRAQIIQRLQDGRLYLLEEKLSQLR